MKKSSLRQVFSYVIFGILTTIVSWSTYVLFVNVFKINVFLSNLLSWIISVTFAFITNKLFVFKSTNNSIKTVVKEVLSFFSSRGTTGVLEIILVPLLVKWSFDKPFLIIVSTLNITSDIFYTNGIYSKVFVNIIVIVLNYFLSKFLVFKNKQET